MMITLNIRSIAKLIVPRGRAKPKLLLADVPTFVREQLDLHGLSLSTDLLAGATRSSLESLRDRGDKVGCACLSLSESQPQPIADRKQDIADAAVQRLMRVVEAASVLGCNSASAPLKMTDTDAALELAAERIQPVIERAERLEINLLIEPTKGLTADPDRLTQLVKKIGGFRVGTLPDFQSAVASDDPVAYLRRLTPYASVVTASTVEFIDPEPKPKPEPTPEPPQDTPAEPDADPKDPAEKPDAEALKPENPIEAALEAALEDMDDLLELPRHSPYDLVPLVGAIASVGFDGTLAIDFRGRGDATLGIIKSREALEAAFDVLSQK